MLILTLALGCGPKSGTPDPAPVAEPPSMYPETRTGDVVDDYHGTQVADPYRWLEDSEDPEVRAWIEAQNALTYGYLDQIPARDAINARMTELWNYERFSAPGRVGDSYTWYYNDGLMSQSVLYIADSPESEGRVLLDPNTLSEDGTIALSGVWFNEAATQAAYAVSDGGSDWRTIRVMDVATGETLDDTLEWVKFSGVSWAKDGSGFYYSRYDVPENPDDMEAVNEFQKLFFHTIGTDQSEDTLIYERTDQPRWGFGGRVTESGDYLVIYNWQGTEPKNRIFYKDLKADGPVTPLLTEFDAQYSVLGNDGPIWYLQTDKDAPKNRVVAIDIREPGAEWREILPEQEQPLEGVSLLGGDKLVALTLQDAHSVVTVYNLDGEKLNDVELPGIGSAGGFGGERDHTETFYTYTSYTSPSTIYRYDLETGTSTVFREPGITMPDEYETTQVFVESPDGTKIPVFLTHKKGIELDGSNPTYLYGYGGFNISLTPYYSTTNRVWLEMGGVLAVANLRGGGEYGQDWHDAGRLANKQNVFDDFIASAEWLIDQGYTSSDKLAIGGGSNGGLLVGACVTQRPDLYGAAMPAVGVMDMLRFNQFTIGWAWESDYGSPQDPEMFPVLYGYSPVHNVKPGTEYPSILVTTGDHDDRVVPGHSFKFTAAMQAAQAGADPVLIRIETRGGHGAGKPTQMRIDEGSDKWAFLVKELDMTVPEGFGVQAAE
jgi:prolyl oligopeptidase